MKKKCPVCKAEMNPETTHIVNHGLRTVRVHYWLCPNCGCTRVRKNVYLHT